ncbi:aminodeoxychorismate/anthranilate synthase component II [Brumimicrobium salinarum]|uniref:Aminodeoxychorismate/anthranilate synthase component II n=1 Tax=Brumimicrobium salinarum TaxID=2058658 RepID=A0A2I0R5H8_9FLAO|nr:aminodeoxychorismate/anthranilate synthase component II [Brumimicrobium salinarum]PKR81833.1 aminodeoxychorismate/anthranilate synthase component II [Brumimicrobium salinarum]
MKILVIDNYDSFTYNLVYILRQAANDVSVFRNDKITPEAALNYDAVVLSPGPGTPDKAGNLMAIIEKCAGKKPILGVCLGHQAIATFLGGQLRILQNVYHGIQSEIEIIDFETKLFKGLSNPLKVGRYHSWDVDSNYKGNYKVTAQTEEGNIMGLENTVLGLYGIQFHPESILTPKGEQIINNFLSICKNDKS